MAQEWERSVDASGMRIFGMGCRSAKHVAIRVIRKQKLRKVSQGRARKEKENEKE